MKKIDFFNIIEKLSIVIVCICFTFSAGASNSNDSSKSGEKTPLNVILFTADDLGPDGVGLESFGGKIKGLTPNLDRIATAGIRFANAHVCSSVCMPSRGIIATGMYGFNSGAHGFMYAREEVPTMMEVFQSAGYKTGVLGKVGHSSAKMSTVWDYVYDYKDLGSGRSPSKYYERVKAFVDKCNTDETPFYLMVNSHDPHRPFQQPDGDLLKGAEWPSKLYSPDEVFVPGFLPNIPQVRKEMSYYYNSTRRLDDTFEKVLEALEDAGVMDNTVIIFMSDNGIAMPFSKANCYLKATRTSLFVYRPGVFKPEVKQEYVSTIDLFPTIMELTGLKVPGKVDGRSFVPLLNGKTQKGREDVFTIIDYINQKKPLPMRCIQDQEFGYIFNAWSDGSNVYKNANEGGVIEAMQAMTDNPEIQARVLMHRHRVVEELYDLKTDPECLINLAEKEDYKSTLLKYREKLRAKMKKFDDPLLETFENVDDKAKMKEMYLTLYSNVLKFRKGESQVYESKIEEMQKNNYE